MSRKVFGWRRSVWWWVAVMEVAVALAALPPSRSFNIGGVLHDNLTQSHFTHALRLINFDGVSVADQTTLYEETTVLRGGPLTTALHVCSSLISRAVFAVVVASPHGLSGTTAAVSYTCGFFHIPVICTHSRDSAFSNKNIHASLLRTVPPYSHQADVWVALMQSFQYRQAILLHSANADGRALRDRFQALARRYTDPEDAVKLAMVVEFRAGQESFVEELGGIRNHLVKVILLYANESDADGIFHDAGYLNLTVDGYVWVVGEQALHSPHAPVGTLALQLKYAHDYSAHITDSLRVVALALRQLHETQAAIPSPPVSCDAEDAWDLTGQTLFRLIREQVLTDGQTGKVAFDEHGDRTNAEYTLLNIQEQLDGNHTTTTLQPVGEFRYSKVSEQMELVVNSSSIVWPGGSTLTPSGYALPKHLKVLTMRETPFVYARTVTGEDCSGRNEVFCPHINDTSLEVGLACCWGYCVDLLLHLASNNDFTFDLFLYPEAQYGHLQQGPHGKEWTGVMGRLVRDVEGEQGMDMVMAPLTITPDRAQHIHFTKPYKYHGITILIKRTVVMPALVSILQPFHGTLWLLLLATVHIIAFFIWLLDRLSPVYKQEGDDTDSLVLSESFWFSWSVILNSGLTDGCVAHDPLHLRRSGFV